MNTLAWVFLGYVGMAFWSAVGARWNIGYVIPDAAVISVVFLALRRGPISFAIGAITLGYLVGLQAIAPIGLHETALLVCALVVYMSSGQIEVQGPQLFAMACGGSTILYHLITLLLTYWGMRQAGFSSMGTMALIPAAFVTAIVALLSYYPMAWLETKLLSDRREGLLMS